MDAKFESVHSRRGVVYALQRSIERFLVGDGQLIVSTGLDEHAQKEIQEVQVLVCRPKRERIDDEAGIL